MKKNNNLKAGFSLVEVMIGIMVLGIAIVSATSLLVGLLKVNRTNLDVLKAYYLAQEGIEIVRNVRDTNWLNNIDFRGDVEMGIYPRLNFDSRYSVNLLDGGWQNSSANLSDVKMAVPFEIEELFGEEFEIGSKIDGVVGDFYRYVEVKDVCENDEYSQYRERGECEELFMVRSVVSYRKGSDFNNVSLEMILTDWKN